MEENIKVIAVTDDDASIRNSLEKTITKNIPNVTVKQFAATVDLKKFLFSNPRGADLLILDIHFGIGETGLDILPDIKKLSPQLPIILLSSMEKTYGGAVTGVAGEYIADFISKPVTETELIIKLKKTLAANNDGRRFVSARRRHQYVGNANLLCGRKANA